MDKQLTIEGLTNTFYEKGEHCGFGCNENDLNIIWNKVIDMAGFHKNVYAVKSWIWYDISIKENSLAVVKSDYVLRTDNRRFDIGDWVRTSPIKNVIDNCICETFSSFYILVGKGSRKESDESIFYFSGLDETC